MFNWTTNKGFVSSFSFLFVNDQIASFQLKQIVVFSQCPQCVFKLISLPDCNSLIIELQQIRSEWRMQLKTRTPTKKELSNSVSCRHFLRIFLYLPVENRVLLFAWIKAKDSDVTRWHLRSKVSQKTSLDGSFVRRCFKKTSDIQDAYSNLARKTGMLSLTSKNYVLLELQIHTRSQQQHVVSLNMNHERALNIKSQINCS